MSIVHIILLLLFAILILKFPQFRLFSFNPHLDIFFGVTDFYKYIRYKRWREAPTGSMICFSGLFGRGKTLSAVHTVRSLYARYNGLKVYDFESGKWVTQKVHVLSNVTLNFPYVHLNSLAEVVSEAYNSKKVDSEQNTRTIILVLVDEASVQLNSREFKKNISADFLNTILTCRHYHMSFFYTSQRFNLTDKLLRDVTQEVYDCRKIWRLQGLYIYDAWTLENSSRPDEVRPKRKTGFFVLNRDYNAYNTLAVVDTLKKSTDSGDMLSEEEVLSRRSASRIDYTSGFVSPSGIFDRLSSWVSH